jgi:hypothetical protein
MHMTETPTLLSSKIRITADPEKTEISSQKHVGFYIHYSSFVLKSIQKHSFQKFLEKMLRKENIQEHNVTEVHVRVFPLRSENGKALAGNCNPTRGKIQIYPKTMTFCRAFKQKFGKNTLLAYVGSRARAALIHELLHLKYATDEKRVRELAKKYFFAFTQKTLSRNRLSFFSYTMIFITRQSGLLKYPKTSGPPAETTKS